MPFRRRPTPPGRRGDPRDDIAAELLALHEELARVAEIGEDSQHVWTAALDRLHRLAARVRDASRGGDA